MKKSKNGFTLVELVIVIGLFAFVVGTSYSVMHSSTIFVNKQINNVNKQNDIRVAIEWITKDLQSSDTLTKYDGGEVLYVVGKDGKEVKYRREELGSIKGEKVYKIFREDSKDKFILMENIPLGGFQINSLENLFDVTIIHKDKFNKDKISNFKVSHPNLKGISIISKTKTPIIDEPLFEGDRIIRGSAEPNASIIIRRGSTIIGLGKADETGSYEVTLNADLVHNDIIKVTALATGKIESDPATATVISGDYMITASPIVSKESSANDGSLEDNIIKVVLNYGAGNFDNNINKEDVIINGLPTGMDFIVVRSDSKELTITLTGKAINHSDANDVNITIVVKNSGFTGNSSHGKDGISNPVLIDFIDKLSSNWENIVVMTKQMKIDGSSMIDAPNSTAIINDNVDREFRISGGDNHLNAKNIYINQKLVLTSGAKIGNNDKSSSIYVNGIVDVDLNGTAYIYGKLYHTQELILNRAGYLGPIDSTKVSSISLPITSIPSLETDSWYAQRGFTSDGTARSKMKLLTSTSYSFPTWGSFEDVNVVSKGNITLPDNVRVTGILFAPNGKVLVSGSSTFIGIIVAKEVELTGNVRVKYTSFNLEDLPFKY